MKLRTWRRWLRSYAVAFHRHKMAGGRPTAVEAWQERAHNRARMARIERILRDACIESDATESARAVHRFLTQP